MQTSYADTVLIFNVGIPEVEIKATKGLQVATKKLSSRIQ